MLEPRKIIPALLLIVTLSVHTKASGLIEKKIEFASIETASTLLGRDDEYTKGWSKFDIDSRMQKPGALKEQQIKYTLSQIREWTVEEKQMLLTQVKKMDELITKGKYHLNHLPEKIILIKSTLADEGGAEGYTRSNAIVLKEGILKMKQPDLLNVLIHEMFHIVSRYDRNLRKDLYAIFGFQLMNEVPYPAELKDFKISNPDAPFKDSYIRFQTKEGKSVDCMMILYADKPYTTGSFFEYLQIGFLKLKGDTHKEADLSSGKAEVFSMKDLAEPFFKIIGQNTEYIIDPEEIVADNFVCALTDKADLPSPELVRAVKERLRK